MGWFVLRAGPAAAPLQLSFRPAVGAIIGRQKGVTFESKLTISARTKEDLRARRASGLPVGRPKGPGKSKLDKHRSEIEALLANGSTQKFIANRYKSSPANLANWMKKRGIKKPKL